MQRFAMVYISIVLFLIGGCAAMNQKQTNADLVRQVADTERAFAKTMADRNFEAFKSFVSPEAVFFSGPKSLRGRDAVIAAWKQFYQQHDAPFSWGPERVEVLDSGTLAFSTGPVHDANGKVIATFNSVWRNDGPNSWHIVFDRGTDACDCQGH